MAKVLVIGGGGREHAIVQSLSASPSVSDIFACPGNGGTAQMQGVENLPLDLKNHKGLIDKCRKEEISMVVIGPEEPLADGLTDVLQDAGIKVFGPEKKSAKLESSKIWAKDFMKRHRIPTAAYSAFYDLEEASQFLETCPWSGIAVKASGLAGGKGVEVVETASEANEAIKRLLHNSSSKIKAASKAFLLEEQLTGYEISVIAFVDGKTARVMPPCQDYKTRFSGGRGPNTGGMGAICPCPLPGEMMQLIKTEIIQKTVDGMQKEGIIYKGVLYAGLMITEKGPVVLEFNCRFGDPETQALLPLLSSDFFEILKACTEGYLKDIEVLFEEKSSCAAISVVIENYPGDIKAGIGGEVKGLEVESDLEGTFIYHAGTTFEESSQVVRTAGGRVVTVCGKAPSLEEAVSLASKRASRVCFFDVAPEYKASFRGDIAFQTMLRERSFNCMTYKEAGVDSKKGESAVERIAEVIAKANINEGATKDFGLFGSVFDLKMKGFKDPLLVSGADGVGTKLMVAQEMKSHSSVGIDLVAMSVNDILAHGAEPLFFLDYFSTGQLEVETVEEVVKGVVEGCSRAGCPLVGGETAEMPGFYQKGEYDLAGFVAGAVERCHYLPRMAQMKPGDVLIGISSSGLHSNGFSLARKIVTSLGLNYKDPAPFDPLVTLGEELLRPTKIYSSLVEIMRKSYTLGAAHITGGGLAGNVKRVIPGHLLAKMKITWPIKPVFLWLFANGISAEEMFNTFNMGIGLVILVSADYKMVALNEIREVLIRNSPPSKDEPINGCPEQSEQAWIIGTLDSRGKDGLPVVVHNKERNLLKMASVLFEKQPDCFPFMEKRRVAVLISGAGTNLQALLDSTMSGFSTATISLVISNVEAVEGLRRAERAGVKSKVISHKMYSEREDFENSIQECLTSCRIEFVFLAGFMRILTKAFVDKWRGRILNVHPSLLPSFKGNRAVKQALDAGVAITGCTVHFVEPEVDAGPIIAQRAVPVIAGDTEGTLGRRIREIEHKICPWALEKVVREEIKLGPEGKAIYERT